MAEPQSKINDGDLVNRLLQAIEQGATYEHACNFAGITYQTLRNWVTRAEEELERRDSPYVKEGTNRWDKEQPYVAFYHELKRSEGNAVVKWLAKIEKAASDGTWQAAAWKLERRHPREYGRLQRQEITGADGGPVEVDLIQVGNMDLDDDV